MNRFGPSRRRLATWAACLAVGGACGAAVAQARTDLAVKVRLTLSLVRFTQWPGAAASPTEPLRLCVWQRAPGVLEAFRAQEGQTLGGRRLVVADAAPGSVSGCAVLFAHASSAPSPTLLGDAARQGVLTVGDADGFAAAGGMVELLSVQDAVRFDVNLAGLRSARLELSSQVLKLARQVRE